ncbi:MAG: protease inhibitor I42 family protein [Candidatus Chlorobium antarcticum]|jgi:predicted secreted protein|nr:protease inhibitor I42 family protein [Candidatus Chlorobium antarcticum]
MLVLAMGSNGKELGRGHSLRNMLLLCMMTVYPLLMGCSRGISCDDIIPQNEFSSIRQYAVELTVRTGETPVVILPQNSASTGYVWVIEPPASTDIAILASRMTLMPENHRLITGVMGGELLQLKTLRPGKCMFTASYVRPWENHNCLPVMQAVITLDVK